MAGGLRLHLPYWITRTSSGALAYRGTRRGADKPSEAENAACALISRRGASSGGQLLKII
ncbi:hypothetical protein DPMN_165312 [Dreissena polymorpha]|uniref:Uncharacterized protein n=1 Tax=Dreissena polymorpha TaxID=45954 RepID=A0A9D4IWG4_DREPO|nr:hypothetical protein DPMN_165312 [Dreissena polymorpha]